MLRRDGDARLMILSRKGAVGQWPRYSDLHEVTRVLHPTFCQLFGQGYNVYDCMIQVSSFSKTPGRLIGVNDLFSHGCKVGFIVRETVLTNLRNRENQDILRVITDFFRTVIVPPSYGDYLHHVPNAAAVVSLLLSGDEDPPRRGYGSPSSPPSSHGANDDGRDPAANLGNINHPTNCPSFLLETPTGRRRESQKAQRVHPESKSEMAGLRLFASLAPAHVLEYIHP